LLQCAQKTKIRRRGAGTTKAGSRFVIGKILAGVLAVVCAAALTLATMIALVQGTIAAVSISGLPLRLLAVAADLVIGTAMLLGCIYLATHLAVRILGVGNAEFPPLPDVGPLTEYGSELRPHDPQKN
jgi:hypothetical protein